MQAAPTNISNKASTTNTARQTSAARMRYVDIAKGIGIISVIVGHIAVRLIAQSRLSTAVFVSIFTFHMPLFFILAGYVSSTSRRYSLSKELKRLVLPYLLCAVVCVLCMMFRFFFETRSLETTLRGTLSWLNAALYGAGDLFAHPLWPQDARIGAIWFLLALFWARLIVHGASRLRFGGLVALGAFLIGTFSVKYVWLPWSIQPGLSASLFVWIGTQMRSLRIYDRPFHPLVAIVGILLWIWAIYLKHPIGMATSYFGEWPWNALIKIAAAIAGSFFIITFSRTIELRGKRVARTLEALGAASLGILCVHLVLDNVINWEWINERCIHGIGIIIPVLLLIESIVRVCCEASVGLVIHRLWERYMQAPPTSHASEARLPSPRV